MGFFDGIKQFGSDVLAVGQQVAGTVLGTGAAALNGAKTLITDPAKFVKDTGDNIGEAVRHVTGGFSDGAALIGEGWNESWATGNPGHFLWKALGGTAQMASMGTLHAFKEHVQDVATVKRDELGHMEGFEISDKADAITRILLRDNSRSMSIIANGDKAIKEAIAEGDADKANRVLGQVVSGAVVQPIGESLKVAGPAAVAAAGAVLTATGVGAPVGVSMLAAGGSFAAGMVMQGKGANDMLDFEIESVADTANRKVNAEIDALKAMGRLSDEQEDDYRETMGTYYMSSSYTVMGDELGASYLGEGATNADLKAVLLQSKGLPSPDEPDVVEFMRQRSEAAKQDAVSLTNSVAEQTDVGASGGSGRVAMELTAEEAAAIQELRQRQSSTREADGPVEDAGLVLA